jgi:hypothetical protein
MTCKVWDAKQGKMIQEVRHQEAVTACGFYSSTEFITAGVDKVLSLWRIKEETNVE